MPRQFRAALQVSPEQGQFMWLLVESIQATRAIEVGTFTGYSSIAIAQVTGEERR